jgi:hypothetical protein
MADKPESPYSVEREVRSDDKREQRDKRPGEGVPDQQTLSKFLEKANAMDVDSKAADAKTMRIMDDKGVVSEVNPVEEQQAEVFTEKTFQKVLAFLDPVSVGPLMLLTARHKLFVVKIPTQQELLDVQYIMGTKIGSSELNTGEYQMSIIGELRKACFGWVPEDSQEAQILRANISWRDKWPRLRDISWQDTRDPYVFEDEIMPLYRKYLEWRVTVVPTRAEIDFYWANQK